MCDFRLFEMGFGRIKVAGISMVANFHFATTSDGDADRKSPILRGLWAFCVTTDIGVFDSSDCVTIRSIKTEKMAVNADVTGFTKC